MTRISYVGPHRHAARPRHIVRVSIQGSGYRPYSWQFTVTCERTSLIRGTGAVAEDVISSTFDGTPLQLNVSQSYPYPASPSSQLGESGQCGGIQNPITPKEAIVQLTETRLGRIADMPLSSPSAGVVRVLLPLFVNIKIAQHAPSDAFRDLEPPDQDTDDVPVDPVISRLRPNAYDGGSSWRESRLHPTTPGAFIPCAFHPKRINSRNHA
ncbi:hypothetical protein C8R44DRAFT_730733 [Mycena epipterygia]|nr:hypothetical protein C8R44DRAFT_730733 [Mycena epipterygia]